MKRRSFLLGLGTALAAPAIVRADSLMKLWVPPAPKLVRAPPLGRGYLFDATGIPVGWYQERNNSMIEFIVNKGPNDQTHGVVSNPTMLRVMLTNGVTPYWPRPFA